jgi:hypothetical protein
VIINYDKKNAHSTAHPQFALETAIAKKSPQQLATFLLSENCGRLSTWRRSPWHIFTSKAFLIPFVHQQSLLPACLFWRKTSALSIKTGCYSVLSLIENTRRVPSKFSLLPPLDSVQSSPCADSMLQHNSAGKLWRLSKSLSFLQKACFNHKQERKKEANNIRRISL